jgi:ribA/ribD-fused uncharacterized protein
VKILFQSRGAAAYRYLSNFWLAPITADGQVFATVEHYYQAQKFVHDPEWFKAVQDAPTPRDAKWLGSAKAKGPISPTWDERRVKVMIKAVRLKFSQHPDLREKLLATGDDELVEYAPWGDTFWGVDKRHEGLNMLGQILMQVRAELRQT